MNNSSLREQTQPKIINPKLFSKELITLPDLQTVNKDGSRFYVIDENTKYPSITTVLSILKRDQIKAWRDRVGHDKANKISNFASSRGTKIHSVCEHYLNGSVDKIKNFTYTDLQTFESIRPIIDNNIDDIFAQEVALYSRFLKVAGRTDVGARWQGKRSIIDFKTSMKPKKREWVQNYFMQSAAYCVCFEELTGIPINQFVIIIAVDNAPSQVFVEKRDDHIYDFIEVRTNYAKLYGI